MNWTKESLKNKKATINMKCGDEESFKWAVTRALNPTIKSSERITKVLTQQSKSYNWEGIDFPTPLEQIETFEKNNNLLINVFTLNEEKGCIQSLRMSKGDHVGRILLMIVDGRYTVVKSISRLLYGQNTKRRCKRFYCNNCLKGFPSEGKLNRHVTTKCGFEGELPEHTEKPRVVCDLCVNRKKSLCPLHSNLGEISGDSRTYIMGMREEILDPKRSRDIFLNHDEDTYKAILKEDEWIFTHLGKKKNTRILGISESGEMTKVEHVCKACVVSGVDCGCSTRVDSCDLCRRQGRDMCALHTRSTTDLRRVRESVMNPNRTYPIRANVRGELYEAVLKEGEWVCSYKGKSDVVVRRICIACHSGFCLKHMCGDSDSD